MGQEFYDGETDDKFEAIVAREMHPPGYRGGGSAPMKPEGAEGWWVWVDKYDGSPYFQELEVRESGKTKMEKFISLSVALLVLSFIAAGAVWAWKAVLG